MRAMMLGFALVGALVAGDVRPAQSAECSCRDCRPQCGYERAGHPGCIYRWAIPTYTPYYTACYVGGGAPCLGGEPRCLNEGTWGRDYSGILFPKKIWLAWYHGKRYQGGGGVYKTDGPHFLEHEE